MSRPFGFLLRATQLRAAAMEPDITAISSSPVADANGRPVADAPAHAGGAETGFAATVASLGAPSAASRVATSNGHANGHGTSNGHGHAHLSIDSLAPATTPWRALAGPVRTTIAGGHYAPAGVSAPARPEDLYHRFGKRMLDVVGATIALVVSAPLVLLAAIAIMIESRGSVLYRSTRVGRGGRPFTFYKLRSMVNGADRHRHHLSHLNECDGPVFKISRDPRVTVVGRFLRTTSLDELPQLWNVLRGDMSLVGPRPPLPEEVSHYQPWQMRRLDVRPGLTCLWQISGRSRIGFDEWMRLDLEYISRRSFRLDLQILLRTIPAVISQEGAY
jgi:lipopolysaccharide/colanic/teichoic acid biosynthesis glycosyltransferase